MFVHFALPHVSVLCKFSPTHSLSCVSYKNVCTLLQISCPENMRRIPGCTIPERVSIKFRITRDHCGLRVPTFVFLFLLHKIITMTKILYAEKGSANHPSTLFSRRNISVGNFLGKIEIIVVVETYNSCYVSQNR